MGLFVCLSFVAIGAAWLSTPGFTWSVFKDHLLQKQSILMYGQECQETYMDEQEVLGQTQTYKVIIQRVEYRDTVQESSGEVRKVKAQTE